MPFEVYFNRCRRFLLLLLLLWLNICVCVRPYTQWALCNNFLLFLCEQRTCQADFNGIAMWMKSCSKSWIALNLCTCILNIFVYCMYVCKVCVCIPYIYISWPPIISFWYMFFSVTIAIEHFKWICNMKYKIKMT